MIRKIDIRATGKFIADVLRQPTANDVFNLIRDTYGDLLNANPFC
jgi:hypothetical protein